MIGMVKNMSRNNDVFEGSEEVEVNEYGEIVRKGNRPDDKKGVRLRPQTFYDEV